MILGIVLEHSLLIYNYPTCLEIPWALLISWLMPMFTVISGYWYKPRPASELADRLLRPMLLFSAVNFFCGYFFYPVYHEGLHLMGYAMWYLWALFIFALSTKWLLRRNIPLSVLPVFSFLLVACYCMLPDIGKLSAITNQLQINRLIGFYPFYLLGVGLRRNEKWIYGLSHRNRGLVLFVAVAFYLFSCACIKGLAYKSGFYLSTGLSVRSLAGFVISYLFIIVICISLISIAPNRCFKFSSYGSKTMNVYLLHMLIVFPLSWGLFSRYMDNLPMSLLNVIIVPVSGIFLFSNVADKLIKASYGIKWGGVILVYVISLLLVNYKLIAKLLGVMLV